MVGLPLVGVASPLTPCSDVGGQLRFGGYSHASSCLPDSAIEMAGPVVGTAANPTGGV
jgi:hypothetical protein